MRRRGALFSEESGAALVLALLATLLAVSLGFAVLATTTTQLRQAVNQRDGLAALDAAEAGASLTVDRLARGLVPPTGTTTLTPGVTYRVTLVPLTQPAGQGNSANAYEIDADGYAGQAHRRVAVRLTVKGGTGAVTVLSWQEAY